MGGVHPLQWARKRSLACGTGAARKGLGEEGRCAGTALFPSLTPAELAAAAGAMASLGPSVAKEPFGVGKILNSIWSNNLLFILSSTEMLRGCWERKEKGFLASTLLSRGTQLLSITDGDFV